MYYLVDGMGWKHPPKKVIIKVVVTLQPTIALPEAEELSTKKNYLRTTKYPAKKPNVPVHPCQTYLTLISSRMSPKAWVGLLSGEGKKCLRGAIV